MLLAFLDPPTLDRKITEKMFFNFFLPLYLSYEGMTEQKLDVLSWEIVAFSLDEGNFWKQRKWIAYSYICSYGAHLAPRA